MTEGVFNCLIDKERSLAFGRAIASPERPDDVCQYDTFDQPSFRVRIGRDVVVLTVTTPVAVKAMSKDGSIPDTCEPPAPRYPRIRSISSALEGRLAAVGRATRIGSLIAAKTCAGVAAMHRLLESERLSIGSMLSLSKSCPVFDAGINEAIDLPSSPGVDGYALPRRR